MRPFIALGGSDRSRIILHARRQQAIGQGGFHSGLLESGVKDVLLASNGEALNIFSLNPFTYVYDCGSKNLGQARACVAKYVASAPSRLLDLLFLSHFDDDHVNGVPTLLETANGLRVGTVVMPWVDEVERMIVWAKAVSSKAATSPLFEALILDPVRALASFNPARIISIRAAEDDTPDDGGPVDIGPLGPDGEGPFRAKVIRRDGDGNPHAAQGAGSREGGTRVFILGPQTVVDVSIAEATLSWLFKPYVRRADPTIIAAFERAAETALGWTFGTFRTEIADPETRSSLVRDKTSSAALARAYKQAVGNRNLTSLCLYSGPNTTSANFPSHLMVRLGATRCSRVARIGWLGSGDISLASPRDGQAFLNHYRTEQQAVSTFGLPHHGAKPNHSMHVLSILNPDLCYAPAKPPKNWKHPHPDVFADAVSIGVRTVKVSDQEETALDEAFAVFG